MPDFKMSDSDMSDSDMSDSVMSDSEMSDSEDFRSIGCQTDEECSVGKPGKSAGSRKESGGRPSISFLRFFFQYYLRGKRYIYST